MHIFYKNFDQMSPLSILNDSLQVSVGSVSPNHEVDISVEMCSPPNTGMFQGKWRMCNPGGNFFGGLASIFDLVILYALGYQ